MQYVYVLLLDNGNLYIGTTSDLQRRILQHQKGRVRSTKNKKPKLLYYEAYLSEKDGINREKYLKTGYGRKALRRQLHEILSTRL